MDGRNVFIGVLLVILLAGGLLYFNGLRAEKQIEKDALIRGEGAQIALTQIFNEVIQCKQLPLTVSNNTVTLIAAECLQQTAEN